MPGSPFGLRFQLLPSAADRVLLAGSIVGSRNGNGLFTIPEVTAFFDSVRVPLPSNIHREFARLVEREHVRKLQERWAVTPTGADKIASELADLNAAALEAHVRGTPGSELLHQRHLVIPPSLAPPKWLPAIERLLRDHPFETNVFLITRFPLSPDDTRYLDPIRNLIEPFRLALRDHGLTLHVASDRQLDDDLLGNVAAHMWACQYAIGILEDRVGRGLNYNVMTEIGAMLMTGRRCALLKDGTVPILPTDVVGQIYKAVDLEDASACLQSVHLWAAEDLGLSRCRNCPPLSI
jgi:hypothetical protein